MFVGREKELKKLNNSIKVKNWRLLSFMAAGVLEKQLLSMNSARINGLFFSQHRKTARSRIWKYCPMQFVK